MRVALTGADGFTGRYVVGELERRGIAWSALECEITDLRSLDDAVASLAFDRLIHLAAIAFAGGSEWDSLYRVNQIGTFNLLECVARHHPGTVCLLASSATVYGPSVSGMVDENVPVNPFNHYAVSKYAMEVGARMWGNVLDIRIARPFNYTGVGQEGHYLVPKIVDHFARRAPEIELGNTHVLRDFGDVRSVATAYCDLISLDQPFSLVNLATGRLSSIADIMGILSDLTGHTMKVKVNRAFVRAQDVSALGGNPSRLRALVPAWEPMTLEATLAWMLDAASGTKS